MKTPTRTGDYARGYQAGYAAAMRRRLGPHQRPLGRPQRRPPIYRCAHCGADSAEADRCPRCQSPAILGEVARFGGDVIGHAALQPVHFEVVSWKVIDAPTPQDLETLR